MTELFPAPPKARVGCASFFCLLGVCPSMAFGAAPAGNENPISMLPMLLVFVAVFYFLMVRPQQKKAKAQKARCDRLATGDEITTSGGFLGTVVTVGDAFLVLNIAKDTEIVVHKHTVAQVLPKGTIAAACNQTTAP